MLYESQIQVPNLSKNKNFSFLYFFLIKRRQIPDERLYYKLKSGKKHERLFKQPDKRCQRTA